jgi:16S rRNA (cytosine967-C5)-methyltransferase
LLCHRPGDEQRYVTLQRSILNNVVSALRNGGILLYTTCSAYRCENEEQTQWLQQQHGLQLLEQQVLPGYRHRADTMFAALLCKY